MRVINRGSLLKAFAYWLPIAVAISAMSALVYLAVQQNFRQNLNDPQIQLTEDAAVMLGNRQPVTALVGSSKVDVASSLAPFLIVYDDSGNVVASSAQLNGQTPPLPAGVFASVRQSGEDRLTWQPQNGVRLATVVTHFSGSTPGFVLAGRSMREVEDRIGQLELMTAAAWGAALVGTLITALTAISLAERLAPSKS